MYCPRSEKYCCPFVGKTFKFLDKHGKTIEKAYCDELASHFGEYGWGAIYLYVLWNPDFSSLHR